MNFFDLINEGKNYSYYQNGTKKLKEIDIFKEPSQYIESYFECGCKIISLFLYNSTLLDDKNRSRHMCSLYALGTIIAEKSDLNKLIENKYSPYIPENLMNHNSSYLYYWFLVSLYHDVGYGIATMPKLKYDLFSQRKSKKLFIKNILESENYDSEIKNLFKNYSRKCFSQSSSNDRFYYLKNYYYKAHTFWKYFAYDNYRIRNSSSQNSNNEYIEHGILGGLLFYNNMLGTFENILTNNSYEINNGYGENCYNRVWFPEQIDIFKDLGFIIATHNLWKKYFDEYGINEPFKFINIKNPLLFLLCLCDTLDPYKYLMKKSIDISIIEDILKEIDIDINKNEITICQPKKNQYDIINCWYNKIKENLEGFISVKVNVSVDNTMITW